jgi:hypothetical protein
MADNPPYMLTPGTITTGLDKIKDAATPERFTQDFLAATLGMKGGSSKPLIPFLKRIGFLQSDGTPTELYHKFRNPAESGAAIAQAMRTGYRAIYEINEKAHELSDQQLKGVIVQATGLERDNRVVTAIAGSFKTLKAQAKFSDLEKQEPPALEVVKQSTEEIGREERISGTGVGMNLSYTINLNLPPTSDIAVFDAIFKSLKEHLLRQ